MSRRTLKLSKKVKNKTPNKRNKELKTYSKKKVSLRISK